MVLKIFWGLFSSLIMANIHWNKHLIQISYYLLLALQKDYNQVKIAGSTYVGKIDLA